MGDNSRVSIFEKTILSEVQNASTKGWAILKFLVMLKKESIDSVCLPFVSQSGFENKLIKVD